MKETPVPLVDLRPLGIPLSRRRFLTGTAAVSLTAVMAGRMGAVDTLIRELGGRPLAGSSFEAPSGSSASTFTFTVARDADLALLDFRLYNFTRQPATGPITALVASTAALITVGLPPQAIGEAAYNVTHPSEPNLPSQDDKDWLVDPPPIVSGVSGPSQLCFSLPNGYKINFSSPMAAADLLDWSDWPLLVPAAAVGPVHTKLAPSDPRTESVTFIEYPYALLISPVTVSGALTRFVGRTPPTPLVSPSNVTDLWTTTLQQTATAPGAPSAPQAAAVWAVDYPSGSASATGPASGEDIAYGA